MADRLSQFEPLEIKASNIETKLKYEDVQGKKKKLVLIQAPVNFDVNSLTGQKFILNGDQILPADENSDKRYEVKSTLNCKKHLRCLSAVIPSFEEETLYAGKSFHGSMVISQSIRVPPVTLPDAEDLVLPEVPDRFLHKWTPFGADKPKKLKETKSRKRTHSNIEELSEVAPKVNLSKKLLTRTENDETIDEEKNADSIDNSSFKGSPKKKSKKHKKS